MPDKWKIQAGPFANALVGAGVGSAVKLAAAANIGRATAERVMRGEAVSFATVVQIVNALSRDSDGNALAKVHEATDLFEADA